MSSNGVWSVGDRVIHNGRPEWGPGEVIKAQPVTHEGNPCQRLAIRFQSVGLKTLSTAFAKLKPADNRPPLAETCPDRAAAVAPSASPPPASTPDPRNAALNAARAQQTASPRPTASKPAAAADQTDTEAGWIDRLEASDLPARLERIPDETKDPFLTATARLDNALRLYRFTKDGGDLIAWAVAQTGLQDPLGRFTRPELERHFDRFRRDLDSHIGVLVNEVRKADPAGLKRAVAAAPPGAQQVLRRVHATR